LVYIDDLQEGQHPLTGQRAPPISGGTYRRRRTLIDGYLESPFYDHPLPRYSVIAADTLRDLVTLTFELLTLVSGHTWRVT